MSYRVGDILVCTHDPMRGGFSVGKIYEVEYVGKYGCTINKVSFGNDTIESCFRKYQWQHDQNKEVEEDEEVEETEENPQVSFSVPFRINLTDLKLYTYPEGRDTVLLQTNMQPNGGEGIIIRRDGVTMDEISHEDGWSVKFTKKFSATNLTAQERALVKEYVKEIRERYGNYDELDEILRLCRIIKSARPKGEKKSAIPTPTPTPKRPKNPSRPEDGYYDEPADFPYDLDDIRLLKREMSKSIILQLSDFDEGKRGIILVENGKPATPIQYRPNFVTSFNIEVSHLDLEQETIEKVLEFVDKMPDEAKEKIRQVLGKASGDTSCILWAEPARNNGKYNTDEEALIDIYKAFARTAFDRLGNRVISHVKQTKDAEIPVGEIVMIAKSHFDDAFKKLADKYGQHVAKDLVDTMLWEGAKVG